MSGEGEYLLDGARVELDGVGDLGQHLVERVCGLAVEQDAHRLARPASVPNHRHLHRSTQPCITPGSLNRVPASAGLRAGMSPLPGGR